MEKKGLGCLGKNFLKAKYSINHYGGGEIVIEKSIYLHKS